MELWISMQRPYYRDLPEVYLYLTNVYHQICPKSHTALPTGCLDAKSLYFPATLVLASFPYFSATIGATNVISEIMAAETNMF